VNDVFKGGSTSVKHEEGQVLLLDFWATWCPPCQAPMAHNQKMLEERKDWGKQVRLIGLSIDNDPSTVKNHVEAKGWTSVEHYHVRTAGCTADKDYGVNGVPHVLLVDTKGKIVFVGHPASRDLEKDIDALLKGETLSGEGT
jgi:thiol-disulfide isomerase/thioredoxin